MVEEKKRVKHITLTSHPGQPGSGCVAVKWGDTDPMKRGPIVGTVTESRQRNVIG
ncbi:MAG: hypothetical protein EBU49_10840, partial [Proteobacteria bacterium]|nr:hypothetical protein [Pseudomonadota bacterium]